MKIKLKIHYLMLFVAICGFALFIVRCGMKQNHFVKKYQEHALRLKYCKDGLRTLKYEKLNWAREQRRDPHILIDASITTPLNEEFIETEKTQKYHEKMKAYYDHACRYPWLY